MILIDQSGSNTQGDIIFLAIAIAALIIVHIAEICFIGGLTKRVDELERRSPYDPR